MTSRSGEERSEDLPAFAEGKGYPVSLPDIRSQHPIDCDADSGVLLCILPDAKCRRKKICRDTLRVRVYRGTNGSLRNPIRDACPCSRMIQPAIRTAAAGNPSGSSMPILMGPMDRCYGDCLRPFQPEVFLCSSGLALPGTGSIPSLHRGRRKNAQMAFSTGLTPSIGQVPYAPIPKQLSHDAHDTSGKGIPDSLKAHPCQADGIPTSIPCKRTKNVLLQQDILAVQSAAAVSARKSVPVSLIPAMADDCNSHRIRRDTLFCRVPAAA